LRHRWRNPGYLERCEVCKKWLITPKGEIVESFPGVPTPRPSPPNCERCRNYVEEWSEDSKRIYGEYRLWKMQGGAIDSDFVVWFLWMHEEEKELERIDRLNEIEGKIGG